MAVGAPNSTQSLSSLCGDGKRRERLLYCVRNQTYRHQKVLAHARRSPAGPPGSRRIRGARAISRAGARLPLLTFG